MKKLTIVFFLITFSVFGVFSKDTISNTQLVSRFEILNDQLEEVRRDQLNYKIEKEVLKETYENNYERISLIITLILGIIGILGYLGIKDINAIKREYIAELANLKQLQVDIASKIKEYEISKEKYDTELRDILKTNEDQNRKIKVIEIKEKILNLFKENSYVQALEYCLAALELAPNDIILLHYKALIYSRTGNFSDSIITYQKILELDENYKKAIFDLAELYLFNNQRNDYKAIVDKHNEWFNEKSDSKLLEIFELLIAFQDNDLEKLKKLATSHLDIHNTEIKQKRINSWDLTDLLLYAFRQKDSPERKILISAIWYINGQINVDGFYLNSGISKPENPDSADL